MESVWYILYIKQRLMDVSTAQLYDILTELNVPKDRAAKAIEKIVSRDELVAHEDRMMKRIYYAMLVQTGAIAAIVFGIISL